jgi:hypothetical protein
MFSQIMKRGLVLCRSKAEIDFLSKLAVELEDELIYQKYAGGWWIDAYSPRYDCWIQFDGVYWHSKPGAAERDRRQNEWFTERGMTLLRVSDKEAKLPDAVKFLASRIRQMITI